MNLLDQRIKTFASQGLSPYEIEEKLGFKHYTIHIEHHEALMEGYARSDTGQKAAERKERRREASREYEANHRKERKRIHLERYANDLEYRKRIQEAQKRYREKHALELSARRRERYWKKKEEELRHV